VLRCFKPAAAKASSASALDRLEQRLADSLSRNKELEAKNQLLEDHNAALEADLAEMKRRLDARE
jgi:hypothetical protein